MKTLWRISYAQRPEAFFGTLSRGIRDAFIVGRCVGVHLGDVETPDSVAQIADFLLTLEKTRWSIVTARYAGRLHVSLRAIEPGSEAGRLLKKILGGGNRGGGHAMIAGGSLEIGADAGEQAWREVEDKVAFDFFASQGLGSVEPRWPFRR